MNMNMLCEWIVTILPIKTSSVKELINIQPGPVPRFLGPNGAGKWADSDTKHRPLSTGGTRQDEALPQ